MAKDLKDYRFSQTKTVVQEVVQEVTPTEIYNRPGGIPQVPEGYEVSDFRPAAGHPGEVWLGVEGYVYTSGSTSGPRFILKEKPKPREVIPASTYTQAYYDVGQIYGRNSVTIPEGWRFVGFRKPCFGEAIISTYDLGMVEVTTGDGFTPRIIVEKIK